MNPRRSFAIISLALLVISAFAAEQTWKLNIRSSRPKDVIEQFSNAFIQSVGEALRSGLKLATDGRLLDDEGNELTCLPSLSAFGLIQNPPSSFIMQFFL